MTIKELLLACDPDLDVYALGCKTTALNLLVDIVTGDKPDLKVIYITTDHEVLCVGVKKYGFKKEVIPYEH